MLPPSFNGSDGFVCGVVYGVLRQQIDSLMDDLYERGVSPEDMYRDISRFIESEVDRVGSTGNRPNASLAEALAGHVADWYYEESDDLVQFCIDNYRHVGSGRSAKQSSKGRKRNSKGQFIASKPKARTGSGNRRR